ncbi:MAG TPA: CDP-alcohol phosphatidyltransferase family protein [Bosea sp. (in: a-proteobacteria)]|nr:CDP-alcohol phosphatidyltransferase family protein [Bosea sp. (in: a-proteobacteria)]
MIRINTSITAQVERKLLIWMALRLPRWIKPDHLTIFGVFGGFVTLLGYALTFLSPAFLWLASFGLVLHWFGDSLDGTLARVRQIERPRYGYFLDQTVDVIGNLLICVGMGISPFVRMDTALLALAGYHALSIYTFVRTTISNEFHVALLGSGPTEIRLMIITMNLLILIFGAPQFGWMGIEMAWCDIAVSLMTLIFFVIFTGLVFSYADELRHKEGSKAAVDAEIARDASASLKMTLEAGRGSWRKRAPSRATG